MNLKNFSALVCAVLLSNCLPYPVIEQPEALNMEGRVFFNSKFSKYWIATKVIAIDSRGVVLGQDTPDSTAANDYAWSIPVSADENTIGTFWVELKHETTGKVYYNEGSDEKFISGGHYDLNVNENNIPIKSAGDLALIGTSEKFPLNESYVLLRNLNLGGEWEPIGKYEDEPFSGVFNGGNRSISGITLPSDSSFEYIGLFGYIKGSADVHAQIKNLNLNLSGTELRLSTISGQCVGILAGAIENTLIEKVNVNGPAKGLRISKQGGGDFYIGGIAGKISGSSSISSSSMLFPFEADADSTGNGYIGGIAGYSKHTDGTILLNKCYNSGLVSINNNGQGVYAGGILGYHENMNINTWIVSTVEECYARNEISASGGAGITAAGGVIGGSTPNGLAGSRSCALMVSVSAYAVAPATAYAGGLSGRYLAGSVGCYQLDAMEIKPAQATHAVNAETIAKSDVTEALFRTELEWDFVRTWRWDAIIGYPKLMWL
jgi:hypothetical protein